MTIWDYLDKHTVAGLGFAFIAMLALDAITVNFANSVRRRTKPEGK